MDLLLPNYSARHVIPTQVNLCSNIDLGLLLIGCLPQNRSNIEMKSHLGQSREVNQPLMIQLNDVASQPSVNLRSIFDFIGPKDPIESSFEVNFRPAAQHDDDRRKKWWFRNGFESMNLRDF